MQSIDQIQWPGWNVVRLIGRGSFGAVYEIQRDVFGETEKAALKVITIPENGADIDDLRVEGYDDESITSRFQSYLEDIVKEYSTMVKMKGHPNVVYCDDVKYVQHDDGIGWDIYIKMELLTPIMKCLDQVENEQSVVDLGIAMCNALVLCKERSIVHRDIKPQNIFISQDGTFKLGDFGIAKTAERTTSGTKVGTYKYMAPEVYNNRPYGPAADQYSLGLVMYWLLNDRRTPFSPKRATASEEDIARKRRFDGEQIPPPAHGSKQLQAIVLKACAYDPKQRFASAAEMLNALKTLSSSPNRAFSPDAIRAESNAVNEDLVNSELDALTVGMVARESERLVEEATIGAFGNGILAASQQGQAQNNQPSVQQIGAYNHSQPAQQANGKFSNPDVVSQKKEGWRKKHRIGMWASIAGGLIAAIGCVVFFTLGKGTGSSTQNEAGATLSGANSESSATEEKLDIEGTTKPTIQPTIDVPVTTETIVTEQMQRAISVIDEIESYRRNHKTYTFSELLDLTANLEVGTYSAQMISVDNVRIKKYDGGWYTSITAVYFDDSGNVIYGDDYTYTQDPAENTSGPSYSCWVSATVYDQIEKISSTSGTEYYWYLDEQEEWSYDWICLVDYIDDIATETILPSDYYKYFSY